MLRKYNYYYQLGLLAIVFCTTLSACTDLTDVEGDIADLQKSVTELQKAVTTLQAAYQDGKVIKSIEPLIDSANGGWSVVFSDNTSIHLVNGADGQNGITPILEIDNEGYWCVSYDNGINYALLLDENGNPQHSQGKDGQDGQNGITPILKIDNEGYWCVSYDNGINYALLLDENGNPQHSQGKDGQDGKEGISIRVTIDEAGYYVYETYYASKSEEVLSTLVTPYTSNKAATVSSIVKDERTHVITLLMADGSSFTFNLDVSYPTSIILLTNKISIEKNAIASFEFRVNPSNAVFDIDIAGGTSQVALDKVSESFTRADASSYITTPINYRLTRIEKSLNEAGEVKVGQFKAFIEDLGLSENYNESVTLVLSVKDGSGNDIQLSSSLLEINLEGKGDSFLSFGFLLPNSDSERKSLGTSGTSISVCLPYGTDISNLKATFTTNGGKVYVGNMKQLSGTTVNDFSSPITYRIVSKEGIEHSFIVTAYCFDLPVVYIQTPNQAVIANKVDWVKDSRMTIQNNDGSVEELGSMGIRGRGNTTWYYPKKPYAIKLDNGQKVLGMPKHKRWVLLANWMDKTLLRNAVAFEIARKTESLLWTPRGQHVEVILNGEHTGNYYLCEQIKIDKNRVNIVEMESNDTEGDAVTGGYIMELDARFDEVNKFRSAIYNLPFMIKEPDEDILVPKQLAYIQEYVNQVEQKLQAEDFNGVYDDIDANTFVDWWFVHELSQNAEPWHPKSSYMNKDKNGKLKAGPVWDFDWGTFIPGATSFRIKNAIWYSHLFKDPTFVALVKQKWAYSKANFSTVIDFIDSQASVIKNSTEVNSQMWPIGQDINGDESMSFDDAVARMKNAYQQRLQWLDEAINSL
jgi:hypothetical protein